MSSSELSSPLTSPPLSEDEMVDFDLDGANDAAAISGDEVSSPEPAASSPKRKREPSPPHERVLADNPDIAFIVMFRSRFNDAFPPKLIQFGPQDIERGVVDTLPSPQVEALLCALLALVLNRKKPVERGHHGRALEDAIQTQRHQWPTAWNGQNPLSGNRSFNTMNPEQRLTLLKSLILWAMNTSEAIGNIIKESYKQSRHDDDLNQPLSVQPWGKDGDKRRYWLIEGRDDTPFRLYRESNPARSPKNHTWRSIAGTIDELRVVADRLTHDGTQAARRLSDRIMAAIPRFEATEEKRKRREYRLARKAQFARPEPGFSLYEGRTRGKRMRYTFSDDEDDQSLSDAAPRRSNRNASQVVEPTGPTVTASGRTVRSRVGGVYGEILHSGQTTGRISPATNEYVRSEGSQEPPATHNWATRSGGRSNPNGWVERKHIEGYNSVDEIEEEEDATSSGAEWEGGDEDEPDLDDEADDDTDEDSEDELNSRSYIAKLHYPVTLAPKISAICQANQSIPMSTGVAAISVKDSIKDASILSSSAGPDAGEDELKSSPQPDVGQNAISPASLPVASTLKPMLQASVTGAANINGLSEATYPTPTATTASTSPAQYSLPYSPQKPRADVSHLPSANVALAPYTLSPSVATEPSNGRDVEMKDGMIEPETHPQDKQIPFVVQHVGTS